MTHPFSLHGRTALVTGAGSADGIGFASARLLAQQGARVVITSTTDRIHERSIELVKEGLDVVSTVGDLTNPADALDIVASAVGELGRLDILVNNAGVTRDTLLPRMSDEEWDDVLTTNLRAPFLFMRAASRPMMQQRYGRIINVASVSGLIGNPGQANYSASKAGLVGLTRTVSKELAGRKVTVNAVAPGFIASDMTAALGPVLLDEVKKRVPAKRLGEAWEIAEAVLFLAAPSSGYITGQVLVVDGGLIG
jgi:3-oxoacyl-[acyl-carrier protein] reductase